MNFYIPLVPELPPSAFSKSYSLITSNLQKGQENQLTYVVSISIMLDDVFKQHKKNLVHA